MPTYQTDQKCYIGNTMRDAGSIFTVAKEIKPLPDWLHKKDLTAAEKGAATKAANKAAKEAEEQQALIDMEAGKKNKDAQTDTGPDASSDVNKEGEDSAPDPSESGEVKTL